MAALGGAKTIGAAAAPAVMGAMQPKLNAEPDKTPQMIRPYKYDYNQQTPSNMIGAQYQPTGQDTSERQYFNPSYTALPPYQAANGGIIALAGGGMPVEQMSNNAAMGANTMYPMANTATSSFATPYQAPQSTNMLANMVAPSGGGAVNAMSGEPSMQGTRMAMGGQVASLATLLVTLVLTLDTCSKVVAVTLAMLGQCWKALKPLLELNMTHKQNNTFL
jgi:hypothetical protein